MAVQELSCQTVVTTSDDLAVAPDSDGKCLEEKSVMDLHSDSLSNASFPILSTIQMIIYVLTQTQKLVWSRVRQVFLTCISLAHLSSL